jgi:hypothetical protein
MNDEAPREKWTWSEYGCIVLLVIVALFMRVLVGEFFG